MLRSIGAGVVTATVIVSASLGSGFQPWPYYGGPMHGGAGSVIGVLWTLLFWTLAAIGAYTVVRWTQERSPETPASRTTARVVTQDRGEDEKAVRSDT